MEMCTLRSENQKSSWGKWNVYSPFLRDGREAAGIVFYWSGGFRGMNWRSGDGLFLHGKLPSESIEKFGLFCLLAAELHAATLESRGAERRGLGGDRPLRGGSLESLGYRGITSRTAAQVISSSTSHSRSCAPLLFAPLHLELLGPPLELFLGLGFFVLRYNADLVLGVAAQNVGILTLAMIS